MPIDQFNTFSIGHFVGQQPGGRMLVVEQSDSSHRRRAAYQPNHRVQASTDNQPQTRLVTVDVHEHSGSRDASVYFNGRQPRQSNDYSDVLGDTSEDTDPGHAQRRGHPRIRQVSPPREGRNGIQCWGIAFGDQRQRDANQNALIASPQPWADPT